MVEFVYWVKVKKQNSKSKIQKTKVKYQKQKQISKKFN